MKNHLLWVTTCAAFLCFPGRIPAQRKNLVLATYTYATNTRVQNLTPLADYLSDRTGYRVAARSYPTVDALIDALWQDSVDLAMINTLGYLRLSRNHPGLAVPMQTLAVPDPGATNYGGCLVALKESGVRSMEDVKRAPSNTTLALVNLSSTSGNLVPRLLLNSAGIPNPDSSFAVHYTGTHKAVVEEVLAGRAAIGGCGCAEVDTARKHLDFDQWALVIASFNDIPLGPIVRHRDVPRKVLRKIDRSLATLHTDQPAIFTKFRDGWTEFRTATRFRPAGDEDYNSFRALFGDNPLLWDMISAK